MRVFFHDEWPALGSGWRKVQIVSKGWKWVTIRSPYKASRKRFTRKQWSEMAKQ